MIAAARSAKTGNVGSRVGYYIRQFKISWYVFLASCRYFSTKHVLSQVEGPSATGKCSA